MEKPMVKCTTCGKEFGAEEEHNCQAGRVEALRKRLEKEDPEVLKAALARLPLASPMRLSGELDGALPTQDELECLAHEIVLLHKEARELPEGIPGVINDGVISLYAWLPRIHELADQAQFRELYLKELIFLERLAGLGARREPEAAKELPQGQDAQVGDVPKRLEAEREVLRLRKAQASRSFVPQPEVWTMTPEALQKEVALRRKLDTWGEGYGLFRVEHEGRLKYMIDSLEARRSPDPDGEGEEEREKAWREVVECERRASPEGLTPLVLLIPAFIQAVKDCWPGDENPIVERLSEELSRRWPYLAELSYWAAEGFYGTPKKEAGAA